MLTENLIETMIRRRQKNEKRTPGKHEKLMEFESDDDVDEQAKNSSDAKVEGKIQVKKDYTLL